MPPLWVAGGARKAWGRGGRSPPSLPASPAQQKDAAPWICLCQVGHQQNSTVSFVRSIYLHLVLLFPGRVASTHPGWYKRFARVAPWPQVTLALNGLCSISRAAKMLEFRQGNLGIAWISWLPALVGGGGRCLTCLSFPCPPRGSSRRQRRGDSFPQLPVPACAEAGTPSTLGLFWTLSLI